MEKTQELKPWGGCRHKITRKLYYQKNNKWFTTDYSYCEDCGSLIKKEVIKNGR